MDVTMSLREGPLCEDRSSPRRLSYFRIGARLSSRRSAMTVDDVRRRFTVDEYLHMAQVGILTTRDRAELLDGEVADMTPIGRPHAACVAALMRVLLIGIGSRAVVWPR